MINNSVIFVYLAVSLTTITDFYSNYFQSMLFDTANVLIVANLLIDLATLERIASSFHLWQMNKDDRLLLPWTYECSAALYTFKASFLAVLCVLKSYLITVLCSCKGCFFATRCFSQFQMPMCIAPTFKLFIKLLFRNKMLVSL